jgi:beta-mannosidase
MRHPRVLLQCLLALGVLWTAAATVSVDLGALEWRMTNGNGSVSLNTTVPAHAVEVLRREGVIFDPMYRYGERESRWVALDYWTFATNFSSSSLKDLKGFRDVVLSFDGIDTFANITLNGKLLATVDSYYR